MEGLAVQSYCNSNRCVPDQMVPLTTKGPLLSPAVVHLWLKLDVLHSPLHRHHLLLCLRGGGQHAVQDLRDRQRIAQAEANQARSCLPAEARHILNLG